MGAKHNINGTTVQYVGQVDRIRVEPALGTPYWTNSFDVVRKDLEKDKGAPETAKYEP